MVTAAGCYITAGRTLWTISRDRATPFPKWLGHINTTFHNPFNATLTCGVVITILACIYLGSQTAFSAFVGCFVQLSSLSYFMAIFPHILSRRSSFVPGYFFMNNKIGYVVNSLACIYILLPLLQGRDRCQHELCQSDDWWLDHLRFHLVVHSPGFI
jgi:amino acid transporter